MILAEHICIFCDACCFILFTFFPLGFSLFTLSLKFLLGFPAPQFPFLLSPSPWPSAVPGLMYCMAPPMSFKPCIIVGLGWTQVGFMKTTTCSKPTFFWVFTFEIWKTLNDSKPSRYIFCKIVCYIYILLGSEMNYMIYIYIHSFYLSLCFSFYLSIYLSIDLSFFIGANRWHEVLCLGLTHVTRCSEASLNLVCHRILILKWVKDPEELMFLSKWRSAMIIRVDSAIIWHRFFLKMQKEFVLMMYIYYFYAHGIHVGKFIANILHCCGDLDCACSTEDRVAASSIALRASRLSSPQQSQDHIAPPTKSYLASRVSLFGSALPTS